MAVPGLPVPSPASSKPQLTHRRRASKALRDAGSLNPGTRRRLVTLIVLLLVFLLGRHYGVRTTIPKPPPFLVDSSKLPPPNEPAPASLNLVKDQKIPPIVHYVFGMSKDFGGKPFSFVQFVAINSALTNIKPERVIFWYRHMPQSWWFDKVQEYAKKHGVVWENKLAREVDEIFGNPVEHFAHKADVIRLEALKQYGGIYLDTDVFVIKDFKPLYRFETVMGMEASPDMNRDEPSGLCNAIILSRPYAPFISRWLDSYADFDRSLWATHSVARPWELARKYPNEIAILDKKAFFWPLWHDEHMNMVHRSMSYDFDKSGQYAYHSWEALAWGWLAQLDPDTIWIYGQKEEGELGETSLTRLARRWVPQDLRNEWRDAHAKGLV